ncbi:MAG: hypothetical protein ACRDRO_27820 [Pseudonocardiaceae bacterium]
MSIARMRARVGALLNVDVIQYRFVPTSDSQGGQGTAHTLLGTMRGRRRQPIVTVEGELAEADVANVTDVIYVASDADVRRNDELHIDDQVFDVHAAYQPSGAIYLRVDCRSRQR